MIIFDLSPIVLIIIGAVSGIITKKTGAKL